MTSNELAEATKIASRRLQALEAGKVDPRYDVLLALAEGLEVPLEQLVRLAHELTGEHQT
jgi:transcriptional regulator with XRE-family HTH domain